MRQCAWLFVFLLFFGSVAPALSQDKVPESRKRPDGVYAVLRESVREKEVLPLKAGEALVIHRHRYLKKEDKEPPRYLVVRSTPDVALDLDGAPKAEKEGKVVVRILLKLQPKAAKALERLTSDRLVRQVTILVGGEVVTMHKVREPIKGGEVQITSCAPGAANHLLEQLEARQSKKRE